MNIPIRTQNNLIRRSLIKKISKISSSSCPTCAKKKKQKILEQQYGYEEARKIRLIEGLKKIKEESNG